MADRVIVAVFKTQNQAYDTSTQLQSLDDEGTIKLKRGAIVTKDEKGNLSIPDTKRVGRAWGLLGGSIIGGLLGAILGPVGVAASVAASAAAAGAVVGVTTGGILGGTADLVDMGVAQDFIDSVSTEINPGDSALIAEIDEGSTEPVDQIVAQYQGTIFRTVVP